MNYNSFRILRALGQGSPDFLLTLGSIPDFLHFDYLHNSSFRMRFLIPVRAKGVAP